MLWEYAMPAMSSWMFISSMVLVGLMAIAVWPLVRWAIQPHVHASLSAPLAPSATDISRVGNARGTMDVVAEPRRVHATLLTVPQCSYSEEAKATLLRLAHEYPLDIDVVALRSPAGDRLAMQGGVLFPPGLFLDDEPFSYGHMSEQALRLELARRSEERADIHAETPDLRLAMAYSRS
jgi:hypothetical protein